MYATYVHVQGNLSPVQKTYDCLFKHVTWMTLMSMLKATDYSHVEKTYDTFHTCHTYVRVIGNHFLRKRKWHSRVTSVERKWLP